MPGSASMARAHPRRRDPGAREGGGRGRIIAPPLPPCPAAMTHRQIGDASRVIRAPRGTQLSCRSWLTEAPFRMIQNNLDPEVAENPAELVVYGGIGRAARNWEC